MWESDRLPEREDGGKNVCMRDCDQGMELMVYDMEVVWSLCWDVMEHEWRALTRGSRI